MKTNPPLRTLSLWLFTVVLVLAGFGCATHEQYSFNANFNQSLPTAPNYYIEDQGASEFTVTVSQGHPSSGQERITDVKRAATAVAEYEAKRRGWHNWRLDYIYQRNEGWMYVAKAKVVRQKALKFNGEQPKNQP